MEDYVEDYKYNNSFWMKSGLLYSHAEKKFQEYLSIGKMMESFSNIFNYFYDEINKIPSLYKRPDDEKSTRYNGIKVLINYIKKMSDNIKILKFELEKISKNIFEKELAYESKKGAMDMCEKDHKNYKDALTKLKTNKESYFDSINKAIEIYLVSKLKGKDKKINQKNLNEIENKRKEYKAQIEKVEEIRVTYMKIQGNIFASEEELERECTNELKAYINKFVKAMETFRNNIVLNDQDKEIINAIDGDTDNKQFAEKNKSLMTGPKRNLFKEYSQDLNYYMEKFECLKKEIKNKSGADLRQFQNKISQDVTHFLSTIIKEEPNQIHNKILEIAKKIKENKCTQTDYQYVENKFQERFDQFVKWKKENVGNQDFKKVGVEWDERYCYMHTFLGYFNKTRVESKELDTENFNYLCQAINKILSLNENEDVDYSLCDLVVILSSTFYTKDPQSKSGKKYINEVIRHSSIMQRQGFWVGLTKYELNEEIQLQKKEEETLNEDNISQDKLSNSVSAKLMSVSFNIMQFVTDSKSFNRIIFDIFKYCKINKENKEIVVGMMEAQIEAENLTHIKLDKDMLLGESRQ
jgi:hypothetical protein